MSNYFLTGASGAVGSAIVPLLLAEPDIRVRVLMRAESDRHLAQRMEELYRFWDLPAGAGAKSRIQAFRGDAMLPQFGLTDGEYAALCTDTTNIIHCAASVRMNKPLEEARRSAVGSAEAILGLARQLSARGSLRKLEFVSTVGVGGKRPGTLPETWIEEPRAFHNTYEQSKAEAEALVKRAIETELLPITVHRPSMVIGNSMDGGIIRFQIFYFICEFLSGRRTLGLYPAFRDVRLDVIPVDQVAEAIVASSLDTTTAGRIFNLCSGPAQSPRLDDLKSIVRRLFHDHGLRIPPDLSMPRRWFSLLPRLAAHILPGRTGRALATLPIYLDYLADQQGFDNTLYRGWLGARQARFPGVDTCLERAIKRYLRQCRMR